LDAGNSGWPEANPSVFKLSCDINVKKRFLILAFLAVTPIVRSKTFVALEADGFQSDTVHMYSIQTSSNLARPALPGTRLPDRQSAAGGLS
jgi:hypothetical protein